VNDKALGALMLVGGIIVIVVYVWALFIPPFGGIGSLAWQIAISIVAIVAVAAVCVIIAWVGYTLITTPTPTPPTLEETVEEETGKEAETEKKE
jgi:membrane protein implicated in regulation of membrane protease activity